MTDKGQELAYKILEAEKEATGEVDGGGGGLGFTLGLAVPDQDAGQNVAGPSKTTMPAYRAGNDQDICVIDDDIPDLASRIRRDTSTGSIKPKGSNKTAQKNVRVPSAASATVTHPISDEDDDDDLPSLGEFKSSSYQDNSSSASNTG